MKGNVLTSDRKIIYGNIQKIQCRKCGLVSTSKQKIITKVEQNYKKNYSYNLSKKGDNFFFTQHGSKERTESIFEWVLSLLPKQNIVKAKTIIEVGCGNGNLLHKFANQFPDKKIIGLEINNKAIKEGRKNGLDIRKLEEYSHLKGDIIISFAVIEHTISPKKFFQLLVNLLNKDGIIVIGQPHQEKVYYDVFFADHLYHFSAKHIEDYGRFVNLIPVKKSYGVWPIDVFSLHILKQSKKNIIPKIIFRKTKIRESIKYYNSIFQNINCFLDHLDIRNNLSVFGLGEIFSLFYAYTKLKDIKIKYGIDDFPPTKNKFSFSIITSDDMNKHDVGTILFCVNPNYYKIVLRRIKNKQHSVFLPFNNMLIQTYHR